MQSPNWQVFIDNGFLAVVTAGIGFVITFLSRLSSSINELNAKIGVIVEKTADHDYRIKRLETQADKE